MYNERLSYMRSFIAKDEYLLMDSTNVFSNSNLITLARKGYNSNFNFDSQFNLMYLYSAKTNMPVYYRLLPGNIREVKAFKNCLLDVGLNNAIIIADKGFYSKENVNLLVDEKLKFILPLKRDNSIINYSMLDDNTFKEEDLFFIHEKRIIWYQDYPYQGKTVFLFLDDTLKINEEKDYLNRIKTHPESYNIMDYHMKRDTFGTITLITNLENQTAVEVYETYKSRMAIEQLFDRMKNVLDADHTYMQDEQTLHGWMFVNHITLQWYQHMYRELKNKGLLKKYSVNDYIQMLTDLKKIKINDAWHLNEITSHASKMMKRLGIVHEEYNT